MELTSVSKKNLAHSSFHLKTLQLNSLKKVLELWILIMTLEIMHRGVCVLRFVQCYELLKVFQNVTRMAGTFTSRSCGA